MLSTNSNNRKPYVFNSKLSNKVIRYEADNLRRNSCCMAQMSKSITLLNITVEYRSVPKNIDNVK